MNFVDYAAFLARNSIKFQISIHAHELCTAANFTLCCMVHACCMKPA